MAVADRTFNTPARWLRGRLHLVIRVVLIMSVVTAPALIERRLAHTVQQYARRSVSASAYLALRSPLIDALLPAGAGGTLFVSTLPDARGLADSRAALIVLAINDADVEELERAEMHERAHLLHAAHDTLVQAIMVSLGEPDASEYAAKNAQEHFAEMAEGAWTLLHPPNVCLAGSPEEQLAAADSLVPGTAGFLLYYLRHPTLSARPDAAAWRAAATQRTAHAAAAWERLFAAVESRRLPNGTFADWPVPSRREWLASERRMMRAEGTLLAQLQALSLWPGALMLQLLGE